MCDGRASRLWLFCATDSVGIIGMAGSKEKGKRKVAKKNSPVVGLVKVIFALMEKDLIVQRRCSLPEQVIHRVSSK